MVFRSSSFRCMSLCRLTIFPLSIELDEAPDALLCFESLVGSCVLIRTDWSEGDGGRRRLATRSLATASISSSLRSCSVSFWKKTLIQKFDKIKTYTNKRWDTLQQLVLAALVPPANGGEGSVGVTHPIVLEHVFAIRHSNTWIYFFSICPTVVT